MGIFGIESLDRFRDAAEDWTSFLQMLNSTNDSIFLADGLNARAYMRALGEFEIAEGIEDAEKALRILPSVPSKRFNTEDTHAYLLHLNGESEKAIKIFERCLKTAEENLRIQQELAESVKNGEKPPQQLRIAQDAVAVFFTIVALPTSRLAKRRLPNLISKKQSNWATIRKKAFDSLTEISRPPTLECPFA